MTSAAVETRTVTEWRKAMMKIAPETKSSLHHLMKRNGWAVTILVFGLLASASAAAAENETYQFRGLGTYGTASSHDDCGYRAVSFSANQSTTHESGDGQPVTSDRGYFFWYTSNHCASTWSYGYAYGDLTISGNSNTLKVSGQVSGWDYSSGSGSPVTVDVDVTVAAIGDYVGRGESTYSFFSPWGTFHGRYAGTYSDAGFSGSITLGSSNLLDGLNNSYASLYTANSGYVALYRQ